MHWFWESQLIISGLALFGVTLCVILNYLFMCEATESYKTEHRLNLIKSIIQGIILLIYILILRKSGVRLK